MKRARKMRLMEPQGEMGLLRLLGRLVMLVVVVLFSACSEEQEDTRGQYADFEIQPYMEGFVEREEMGETRADPPAWVPSGYYTYTDLNAKFSNQKNLVNSSIQAFFTRDDNFTSDGKNWEQGMFYYALDNKWRLRMQIDKSGDYYVYGFIPQEEAISSSVTANTTFSNGAVLNIHGLSSVTASDVCVIVGAKEGTDENTVSDLVTGKFKVNAKIGENLHNYIFLLFDHLYAALRFNFTVDETYNELRTIKLKKLELIANSDDEGHAYVYSRYNAEVTLKQNNSNTSPIVGSVTFTPVTTSSYVDYVKLFDSSLPGGSEVTLTTTKPESFMGCFVPGDNTYFTLRSTYDVYDKNVQKDANGAPVLNDDGTPKCNLVRKDCIAENMIDLRQRFSVSSVDRGHSYSLTVKVQPTYLYVLSDPDLDNPTLTVQ